jgi:hypothetical protein
MVPHEVHNDDETTAADDSGFPLSTAVEEDDDTSLTSHEQSATTAPSNSRRRRNWNILPHELESILIEGTPHELVNSSYQLLTWGDIISYYDPSSHQVIFSWISCQEEESQFLKKGDMVRLLSLRENEFL